MAPTPNAMAACVSAVPRRQRSQASTSRCQRDESSALARSQAKPGTSTAGYQILGPYSCDKSFFKYCKGDLANSNTGSTIYVGPPIGTAAGLTAMLTGKPPPSFNECGAE